MAFFASEEIYESYETEGETYEYYEIAADTQEPTEYADYSYEPEPEPEMETEQENNYASDSEDSEDTCDYDPNDGGEYFPSADESTDSESSD